MLKYVWQREREMYALKYVVVYRDEWVSMYVYYKMCNEKKCACVEVYYKICESKRVCENVYMYWSVCNKWERERYVCV